MVSMERQHKDCLNGHWWARVCPHVCRHTWTKKHKRHWEMSTFQQWKAYFEYLIFKKFPTFRFGLLGGHLTCFICFENFHLLKLLRWEIIKWRTWDWKLKLNGHASHPSNKAHISVIQAHVRLLPARDHLKQTDAKWSNIQWIDESESKVADGYFRVHVLC